MESYLLGIESGCMALILVCQSVLRDTKDHADREGLEWDKKRAEIGLQNVRDRLTALRKYSECGQTAQNI